MCSDCDLCKLVAEGGWEAKTVFLDTFTPILMRNLSCCGSVIRLTEKEGGKHPAVDPVMGDFELKRARGKEVFPGENN